MTDRQDILKECSKLDSEGRNDASISLLSESILLSPDAVLYYERGCRLEDVGQYLHALDDYTAAIQIDPLVEYLLSRGLLLSSRLSNPESGLRDFEQALATAPNNLLVHLNLVECNLQLGKRKDAIEHARMAVTLAPMNGQAHACLGQCLLVVDEPKDAAEQLEIAISLDPAPAGWWKMLARALRKTGRLAEAKISIERALECDRPAWYLINYARILLDMNEPLRAIEILQEAQQMHLTEDVGYLAAAYLKKAQRMLDVQ